MQKNHLTLGVGRELFQSMHERTETHHDLYKSQVKLNIYHFVGARRDDARHGAVAVTRLLETFINVCLIRSKKRPRQKTHHTGPGRHGHWSGLGGWGNGMEW